MTVQAMVITRTSEAGKQKQEKVPMNQRAIGLRLPRLDSRLSRLRPWGVCGFAAGARQWRWLQPVRGACESSRRVSLNADRARCFSTDPSTKRSVEKCHAVHASVSHSRLLEVWAVA
jgi:hypothetical protein